jgi:hypothetical protein
MKQKEFLRWVLAESAFKEANSLTVHVMQNKFPPTEALYSACMTGIATAYCRPFMGANGMGALPKEIKNLGNFPGERLGREFKIVHEMLVETRTKIGGHFDRVFHEQLHAKGGVSKSSTELIVTLKPTGSFTEVRGIAMDPDNLEFVHGLCLLQIQRAADKVKDFAKELLVEKEGEFGTYLQRR